jgi:flagellar protein FliJ
VNAAAHADDRGLSAVGRVREVRERDSRLGLQQTLRVAGEHESTATGLASDLDHAPAFTTGTTAEFVASRAWLAGMAARLEVAQQQARQARMVAEEARVRWQADKTRLRAVEHLLERRAETRRLLRDRAEARELDDIASQGWIRRQGGGTP